ncbi:substrate-binding domain-containing protein [Archangium sp.]|uniref:substrate-binding domain-containing protein n=1 Tax=Archangium sp. TaxID=1872627 RepID=UPI00286A9283|nr:substrate-binding domain-containing protein [Archangium sp.]
MLKLSVLAVSCTLLALTGCKPAPAPVTLRIVHGGEAEAWLEVQARKFEALGIRTALSNRPIRVEVTVRDASEAIPAIVDGTARPHVFFPASTTDVARLERAWRAGPGQGKALVAGQLSVLRSPLVIAMPRVAAEALGWPEKPVGWEALLRVAASPEGWAAFGHPEWGAFKLAHAHPEVSSAGLLGVWSVLSAGARQEGAGPEGFRSEAARDFLGRVEAAVPHYAPSPHFFVERMREHGPEYLSAVVAFAHQVGASSEQAGAAFPLVDVSPPKALPVADHPFALLEGPWVAPEESDAARVFLDFLLSPVAQDAAVAGGFQRGGGKAPATELALPDATQVEEVLAAWRAKKKNPSVVVVLDQSARMAGKPLEEARAGFQVLLDSLRGPQPEVSLFTFGQQVGHEVGPFPVEGEGQRLLTQPVAEVRAGGKAALYDGVASGYDVARARARAPSSTRSTFGVVVLTAGRDEGSSGPLPMLVKHLRGEPPEPPPAPPPLPPTATPEERERRAKLEAMIAALPEAPDEVMRELRGPGVPLFLVTYGGSADTQAVSELAKASKGQVFAVTPETQARVLRQVAAFF